jgi:predicted Zn-dependent protease with MMP-like domain
VESLLDEAAQAYESARWEEVLEIAGRALKAAPGHPEALHFRAAALAEQGDLDGALEVYRHGMAVAGEDLDLLLAAADLLVSGFGDDRSAVEEGLELCRKGRKLAARRADRESQFELTLLEAIGANQVGECRRALQAATHALELEPGSPDALRERAIALFELCRFDAAEKDFRKLTQQEPDDAWAHHYLGLLAERRKDGKEARRRFLRAQQVDPEEFPPPVTLTQDEFDRAVADAVEGLPAHVKKYLDNTTISVEDVPQEEDLTSSDPPLSPCILGVFRGTPIGERSVSSAYDHFPAAIVLYQRNLERFARTREELIEQIGITLLHEVGHLVGLDEEDLWERGLE